MPIFIDNFALAGFRSFGRKPQRIDVLAKVTLLIGRNNCGKSNIIRFISDVYPSFTKIKPPSLNFLDAHMPSRPAIALGKQIPLERDASGRPMLPLTHPLLFSVQHDHVKRQCAYVLGSIVDAKREIDGTSQPWAFQSSSPLLDEEEAWKKAIRRVERDALQRTWSAVTHRSGGSREQHWEPETLALFRPNFETLEVQVIPAVRRIGDPGTSEPSHDGTGIITRLAQLQNPTVERQDDRQRFFAIRDFLRDVTDSADAEIEIPHDRQTIIVHMHGKALPVQSLGTGIHEVIILAAAATVHTNCVMCIEEPELHLNPLLQRKLLRYLTSKTENQYIISTHSAAIMDTPGAEVYHVRIEDGCSVIDRVTSDASRSTVCHDLGYHPSDLMQANSVIWVEGPSDRIYLNHWLASAAPDLVEGIHYSIMFYGGKLASHLSFESDELAAKELISLRRLNRRAVIVIDSDRSSSSDPINSTKARLQAEFDQGPGHTWITSGREIENYVPSDQIRTALLQLMPGSTPMTSLSRYQNCLKVKTSSGKLTQASKVRVAHLVTSANAADLSLLDLQTQINKLVRFILDSNPLASAA